MSNKFEIIDELEQEEMIDAKVWIRELIRIHKELPAERQACCIIREYVNMESPTPAQRREFFLWIADEENAETKKKALDIISNEYYYTPGSLYTGRKIETTNTKTIDNRERH